MQDKIAMPLVLIFILVFLVVATNASSNTKAKLALERLKDIGINLSKGIVPLGKYISGHPGINNPVLGVTAVMSEDILKIISNGAVLGEINKKSILGIDLEDGTTIERRVTVGRLLVAGVFAFALKKAKKHELAYVVIKWNDGKFNHDTIFEFEGLGSLTQANSSRNVLVRLCS